MVRVERLAQELARRVAEGEVQEPGQAEEPEPSMGRAPSVGPCKRAWARSRSRGKGLFCLFSLVFWLCLAA